MYFSDENTLIRLEILGYEFNTFSYDEDADWLNVKIEVNDKKENLHWIACNACLRTFELKEIKNWFLSILNKGKFILPKLSFMEPELSFIYKDGIIGLKFNYAFHPEWGVDFDINSDGYALYFKLNTNSLLSLISELDKLICAYPCRSEQA